LSANPIIVIFSISILSEDKLMQAIELDVPITENHEIHLKLPDDVNATSAKIIILYENNTIPLPKKRIFGQFRNKIKIAEDFDDELPLEFWLDNQS
jgi:hypothetical protein